MAKPPDPFHDFVAELFAPMGPVTIKRMFGGAGVYADGVMFALVADDEIYLKVDDALKSDLEAEGSEPFSFEMKDGKSAQMNYYRIPSDAMDHDQDASDWGRRALDVALKAKAAKAPKKTR
jgi:DNA transformation protein